MLKCFCYILPQCHGCLKKKHLCDWVTKWTSCFSHRTVFLLSRMTEKPKLFILGYWQTFSRKWCEPVLQEKQTIKLELSRKARILENFICHWELDSFPTLQVFSNGFDSNVNECGFSGVVQCQHTEIPA